MQHTYECYSSSSVQMPATSTTGDTLAPACPHTLRAGCGGTPLKNSKQMQKAELFVSDQCCHRVVASRKARCRVPSPGRSDVALQLSEHPSEEAEGCRGVSVGPAGKRVMK